MKEKKIKKESKQLSHATMKTRVAG
jgi:hypothetical protein